MNASIEREEGEISWLWNENFWLPTNVTWSHLTVNEDLGHGRHPLNSDIVIPFFLGVCFLVLRYLLESYVYRPFALSYGIKVIPAASSHRKRPHLPAADDEQSTRHLEAFFQQLQSAAKKNGRSNSIHHDKIRIVAEELDWTPRRVNRWLRKRKAGTLSSTVLKKFSECSWRFTFYLFAFVYGCWCLWDKSWFWDISTVFDDYPYHLNTWEVRWYYCIETAFYWSLVFSLITDTRRKDFVETVIHHCLTLVLLNASQASNFIRLGCVTLLVHDIADIFIELAKMFKYLDKNSKKCETLFVVFSVVWFTTRTGYYPFKIIRTCLKHPPPFLFPVFNVFCMLVGFLCILFVLHLIWSYMIIKLMFKTMLTGTITKDCRSETEDSDSNDENHHSHEE